MSLKIMIIEDEKPAAEKLKKALMGIGQVEVVGLVHSIRDAVDFLSRSHPDLIFMDIELSDGSSFDIFRKVSITCPVIFVTAYDDYWQQAFEHHSLDYILKPVKQEKLQTALNKYESLKQHFARNFEQLLHEQGSKHKKRFLVKRGSDYLSINSDDIAYFYATHKMVCLVGNKNQRFILDESLSILESQLNPDLFFRVNRKYLVNIHAIKRIQAFSKSKLALQLEPAIDEEVIVPQENVSAFKQWMGE